MIEAGTGGVMKKCLYRIVVGANLHKYLFPEVVSNEVVLLTQTTSVVFSVTSDLSIFHF